ncbi:MAG: 16S rRNA (adenine(1518)-N(6)/adenine(1519)-N(6))-dimethyltransferase RsmA [Coriobacteriia bacterium]|nr:16S rRNA (adenine(1518)-N(6)/adenine(1519)-N(6))-dimethyltransferase RsmA [Coriobacteriia bacterium]
MPHSPLASPSATLDVLRAHGLHAKKSLGQHFLVDDNVVGRILALAGLSAADAVLEVGPGIGTLTLALCRTAGAVVAVERDAELLPVLAETTAACPEVRVVHADALHLAPEELSTPLGPPTALVANLPYAVAATVVLRALQGLPSLRQATVMVQSEVADRMSASPGGKEYGAYTVKLRLVAAPAGRFPVSRRSFLPPPNVDSAVIRLERAGRPEPAEELAGAAGAANAAFAQRRKTLRNSLASSLGASPEAVAAALVEAGVDGARRAETLDVEEYLALGRALLAAGLLRG